MFPSKYQNSWANKFPAGPYNHQAYNITVKQFFTQCWSQFTTSLRANRVHKSDSVSTFLSLWKYLRLYLTFFASLSSVSTYFQDSMESASSIHTMCNACVFQYFEPTKKAPFFTAYPYRFWRHQNVLQCSKHGFLYLFIYHFCFFFSFDYKNNVNFFAKFRSWQHRRWFQDWRIYYKKTKNRNRLRVDFGQSLRRAGGEHETGDKKKWQSEIWMRGRACSEFALRFFPVSCFKGHLARSLGSWEWPQISL